MQYSNSRACSKIHSIFWTHIQLLFDFQKKRKKLSSPAIFYHSYRLRITFYFFGQNFEYFLHFVQKCSNIPMASCVRLLFIAHSIECLCFLPLAPITAPSDSMRNWTVLNNYSIIIVYIFFGCYVCKCFHVCLFI